MATLLGSGTSRYPGALAWASVTTLAGSLVALVLARGLLKAFSGKGLVPAEVVADPSFALAVGMAAAGTVAIATRLGLPISTTHSLIGALVGAGLAASGGVALPSLGRLMIPLATSPLLALVGTWALYRVLRDLRQRSGVTQETCVCVGAQVVGVVPGVPGRAQAMTSMALPTVSMGEEVHCRVRYAGRILGLNARWLLDVLHYLSAGAVSFSRGVNDTPKIAALLLVAGSVQGGAAIVAVALAMLAGGVLAARRVAETKSASRAANGAEIRRILLAWLVTLPLAGLLAALSWWVLPVA